MITRVLREYGAVPSLWYEAVNPGPRALVSIRCTEITLELTLADGDSYIIGYQAYQRIVALATGEPSLPASVECGWCGTITPSAGGMG